MTAPLDPAGSPFSLPPLPIASCLLLPCTLQVFPHIAADNRLFAYTLNGYWMDVGQPKDYLKGAASPGRGFLARVNIA